MQSSARLGYSEPDKLPVSLATAMTKIIMGEPDGPDEGILYHDEGIDLMPSNIELSAMEVSLVKTIGNSGFAGNIASVTERYINTRLKRKHGY